MAILPSHLNIQGNQGDQTGKAMDSKGMDGRRIVAIRGATTIPENSVDAVQVAVTELLDDFEMHNPVLPSDIVSVMFSVTRDIDAVFPAAIARQRPNWDIVPLMDVQHMYVEGSLPMCIRFLIHVYMPIDHQSVHHPYLRNAQKLRPDWCGSSSAQAI